MRPCVQSPVTHTHKLKTIKKKKEKKRKETPKKPKTKQKANDQTEDLNIPAIYSGCMFI
jgi:hypothetical protein